MKAMKEKAEDKKIGIMTQEEKQLLLQDLCPRLPYGVCVHIRYKEGEPCYGKLTPRDIQWFIDSNIENIKPYLRPMSSMTEEEKKELIVLFGMCQAIEPGVGGTPWYNAPETKIELVEFTFIHTHKLIDWLNKHHFDYRGLIEKGLALEAPEGMYD